MNQEIYLSTKQYLTLLRSIKERLVIILMLDWNTVKDQQVNTTVTKDL